MSKMLLNLKKGVLGNDGYHANETLKGTVSLLFEHPKEVRACYIIIKGSAECNWSRKSGKSTSYYHGNEVYINTKTYVFGRENGSLVEVPAGLHKYDFECLLPPQIPGSFKGSKGEITYFVEAVLDIPWRFDKEVKNYFHVIRLENLNDIPDLKMPMELKSGDSYCCCFYFSGKCKMIVSIPHRGYSPGSFIPIKIHYNNQSIIDVDATRFILKRITTFHGKTNAIVLNDVRTKVVPEVLIDVSSKGAKKGTTLDFGIKLEIPKNTPHSETKHCSIIQIDYFLKVKGSVGLFHSDLVVKFPIKIGATGIGEPNIMERLYRPRQPSPRATPTAPPSTSLPSAPLFVDEDLPPTFEEAVGYKKTSDHEPLMPSAPEKE